MGCKIKYIFSKKELEKLYLKQKLPARKIAEKLKCSKTTVMEHIKKHGIKLRSHSEAGKLRRDHKEKYVIPVDKLKELYYCKKLSMKQIGDIYGVYSSVIYGRFKKYGLKSRSIEEGIELSIPRRSKNIAKAVIKYPKNPFSGDLMEKAYLFGFAAGDLYIHKNKYGETIFMGTSSTKKVQVNLVKNLFERYTKVYIHKNKYKHYQISCYLHCSFDFLLDYKKDFIPEGIYNKNKTFLSFLGGYIDAEGHFGVYKNIGGFSLGSYDKNILFSISKRLKELGIFVDGPKLKVKKGYIDKRGVMWNGDLWVLRIRRMRELYKFINIIKPFIRHEKRYKDMISVKDNLLTRTRRINLNEEFFYFDSYSLC